MFKQQQADDADDQIVVSPDPSALVVDSVEIRGSVFVVPTDAALPNELTGLAPTGSLYARLAPLGAEPGNELTVCLLSGSELTALAAVWRALVVPKRVFVLMELPGVRYDVVFTQAGKTIGLRRLDWPEVAEAVSRRAAVEQSTKDSTPWALPGGPAPKDAPASPAVRKGVVDPFRRAATALPIPEASDED